MHEPILPDPVSAEASPTPVELARSVAPAGATDARSLTVVYAPVTVTHHHAPAAAPAIQSTAVRMPPTPSVPVIAAHPSAKPRSIR